jgi:hypothetical protein
MRMLIRFVIECKKYLHSFDVHVLTFYVSGPDLYRYIIDRLKTEKLPWVPRPHGEASTVVSCA